NAGKIGTGNRLAAPYQVENDTAINVASRLARGDLRISKVNAFHLVLVPHYIVDKFAINCTLPPQSAANAKAQMQATPLTSYSELYVRLSYLCQAKSLMLGRFTGDSADVPLYVPSFQWAAAGSP